VPGRSDHDAAVANGPGLTSLERGAKRSKRLILQRLSGRTGVASGLLGLGLIMTGCLVPQDFPIVPDDPVQFKNRLPQIRSFLPADEEFTVAQGDTFDLRVTISDEDVDDTISVRWYVDWDQDNPTGPWREQQLANTGDDDRPAAELRVVVCGSPLEQPGLYKVEAVAADGNLINRVPQPKETVPDAGENLTGVDTQLWLIHVESGSCQ
jgi:hypothetical protein